MSERGGPTTQSGIFYQNSVAALFLGELCDGRPVSASERVTDVRVEAPEHVDDVVVTYADGHRTFIQAKEALQPQTRPWTGLWKDFEDQFWSSGFGRTNDRLFLYVGERRDDHHQLEELCRRAAGHTEYITWQNGLSTSQKGLVSRIRALFEAEHQADEDVYSFFRQVDVVVLPLEDIERDKAPVRMPPASVPAFTLFRLLRDRIGGHARYRRSFTRTALQQSLAEDAAVVLPTSSPDIPHSLLLSLTSLLTLLNAPPVRPPSETAALDAEERSHAGVQALAALQMQSAPLGITSQTISLERIPAPLMLDLPPMVEHLSERRQSVNSLLAEVRSHTWTALEGGMGAGKTLLVTLAARTVGTCHTWIRLRGLDADQSAQRLDLACATVMGAGPQRDWETWYTRLCQHLERGAVLVLDDMPKVKSGDPLSERLLRLVRVCHRHDVHLISTSMHSLPLGLRQRMKGTELRTLVAPPLSDGEAAEILLTHGAPLGRLEAGFARTVNTYARRHPQLVATFAHYMSQRGWQWTDQEFEILLMSGYTGDLNEETIDKLLETVEDVQSRELLYRLTLSLGAFSLETAHILAAVEPSISRPRERLSALSGLWVQRESEERLLVSPLVQFMGPGELDPVIRNACRRSLGEQIMSKGRVNQNDVANAITYFAAAEDFDRAGGLLAWGLSHIKTLIYRENDMPPDTSGLLSYWWEAPLPGRMRLDLRLHVRAQQIALGYATDRNVTPLIENFGRLLADATEAEGASLLAAVATAGEALAHHDFTRLCSLLRRVYPLLPGMRLPSGEPLRMPEGVRPESLIWWFLKGIQTPGDLREWTITLEHMTPEQRAAAFADDLADDGCLLVTNRLWLSEADRPASERQWEPVLDALRVLAGAARGLSQVVLWACAVRAQIIVRAEYVGDVDGALAAGQQALREAPEDPRACFLLQEVIGRQYGLAGRTQTALDYLGRASQMLTASFPLTRFQMLLEACRLASPQDTIGAVRYAEQAVTLARTSDEVPVTELIKALAELMIAQWQAGDLAHAFASCDEGAELLFGARADTERWKELFILYGHVSGYLSYLASHGRPLTEITPGTEYAAPQQGMFLVSRPEVATLYDPSLDSVLPGQLALFAEAIGSDGRAGAWSRRGLMLADAASVFATASLTAIPVLIMDGHHSKALDVALQAGAFFTADMTRPGAGTTRIRVDMDVASLLGDKPSEAWDRAEYNAAIMAVIPSVFHLATVCLDAPEEAQDQAAHVVRHCRDVGRSASDARLWTAVADQIEDVFVRPVDQAEILRRANTLVASAENIPRLICLIGTTLQKNITPEDVLRAHMTILPFVGHFYRPGTMTYRRIIVSLITRYWVKTVRTSRFRFTAPQSVEQELQEALVGPPEKRAQLILRAVASGLGVYLPEFVKEWLTGVAQTLD